MAKPPPLRGRACPGLDPGSAPKAPGEGFSAVTISAREQALVALQAAAELGQPVALISLPFGASSVGAGWFRAVIEQASAAFPSVTVTAILDCGDRADLVQAALRHGVRDVCFRGEARVRRKLADIAAQYGARLHAVLPESLDLAGAADPPAACRAWLSRPARRRTAD